MAVTTGLATILTNLNREIDKIGEGAERGALAAAFFVQGEAQRGVPVEYGKLRASAYTQAIPRGGEVGFTAEYAVYVHENLEVHAGQARRSGLGVYWGPAGHPKYLETPLKEKRPEILEIIRREAAIE